VISVYLSVYRGGAGRAAEIIRAVTVEAYLETERATDFRSEYINGEVFAMAGEGVNHALIATAAAASLGGQLDDKPCAVVGSNLRLFCQRYQMLLTYPDVVVFCEPAKFLDGDRDTLVDATVIVEVLSRSTQNYDRGEKIPFLPRPAFIF
jgi:Uma2 family endonuclease